MPPAPCSMLDDLRGLNRSQPTTAIFLAVCLLSLTGLPPTVGFFGKLNLFLAAWGNATTLGRTLAVLMALNAAISAWYYLRLVALMFLDPASEAAAKPEARLVIVPGGRDLHGRVACFFSWRRNGCGTSCRKSMSNCFSSVKSVRTLA